MRRRFLIGALVIVACGAAWGLAAPFGTTGSPGQNNTAARSTAFEAGFATHETRIESQTAPEFPSVTEMPTQGEIEIPAPTRASFMASWDSASDAIGYLLDVSTNNSFSSYVNGYHDLEVGNLTARVVTGLNPGTTYYYRVRAYNARGSDRYSDVMSVTTVATAGMIIHATFDSSITNNPNAAAIEAMINRAISIYESLFSDPITIEILYRYSTAGPDGTPLPAGTLSQSDSIIYMIPWDVYINALRADARTNNDILANASLPATALSATIKPKGPNGRAIGLNTPPAMFANGTLGDGGPFDGIVTLNSSAPFQFTRPVSGNNFDAQNGTEHETDEIIALTSRANISDLRPQDLFSWSSASVRNISTTGARYFSINGGFTNIVNFNQNPSMDLGDWLSTACPQAHPYVQNAAGCRGQSSDVTATSPEGINLDVVGYDLVTAPRAAVGDFNSDGHPDYVLRNPGTRQTAIWYLNNNIYQGGALGPSISVGWVLEGVADFDRDVHPDYALFNPTIDRTAIWYMSGPTRVASAYGPTLPGGWELVATGDFNGNGYPDYVLYNASTRQTAIWYLNNNVYVSGGYGPTLPVNWSLVGVADFNRNGNRDYVLFNSSNHQTAIWYLSGQTFVGGAYGPTIPSGWALVATA
ncbi:MAG TPA: NF038122 family metalloprotease, partial [Candidatus Udaeobacter sp.]|nr:NF038122 family metalloprotease [Candidatus Udaeobacter sp.]